MSDAAKGKDFVDSYLLKKYDVGRCIGKGAYGIVWKVTERGTGRTGALKKCFDAFQNSTDAQRTFREIMFLQELNGHANIVTLRNVLKAECSEDIYVLFDAMETDLSHVISAGFLTPIHQEYVTYQCLKALKYVHSAGVLHRDLKPSNLLLNSNCHVRLCDFGLARTAMTPGKPTSGADAVVLTDYVATRWYRAPELLLGAQYYHEGVDMWSVGCILGEMVSAKPILKGRSTMNQLEKIVELTAKPSEEDLRPISSTSPYCKSMMESVGNIRQLPSASILFLVKAPPAARRLILTCLRFNPDKRPTAEQCLEDPFVEKFHLQEAEPVCDKILRMPIPDNNKMKAVDYRQHIYTQILNRQKQAKLDKSSRGARGLEKDEAGDKPWFHEGGAQPPPTTPDPTARDTVESAASPGRSKSKDARFMRNPIRRLSRPASQPPAQ